MKICLKNMTMNNRDLTESGPQMVTMDYQQVDCPIELNKPNKLWNIYEEMFEEHDHQKIGTSNSSFEEMFENC